MAHSAAALFRVADRGLGRVALRGGEGFLSVLEPGGNARAGLKKAEPTDTETFQWIENVYGDLILMSLATHRHLRIDPESGGVFADHPGPKPDRKDGSCLLWKKAVPNLDGEEDSENPVLKTVRGSREDKPISP